MPMEKSRFDELDLEGREVECPRCHESFNLTIENTVGGGYGVVGLDCPLCGKRFQIEAGE